MKQAGKLNQEIDLALDFRGLMETYEEVAAEEMKKIRKEILKGRSFLEGLANLSTRVGADLSTSFKAKKKKAIVLLSADEGLYGDVVERVFFKFLEQVKQGKERVLVSGRVGQELMRQWADEVKYDFFSEQELLSENVLGQFSDFRVFYAKFENVARQSVTEGELSGRVAMNQVESIKDASIVSTKYIYEPSASKIAGKFGQEIMASVLAGMAAENHLSKQASRLVQLDEAVERIDSRVIDLEVVRRQHLKRQEDVKQQSRTVRLII